LAPDVLVSLMSVRPYHCCSAWFAALAIEHGCHLISTDVNYGGFAGLRWQRPFE